MPQFLPVQSLYSSCLDAVFEHLFVTVQTVQRSSNSIEILRKVVQSSLHSGIRQHLVHLATAHCRNNVYLLLDLLRILLDPTIKKLDHSCGDDNAWLRPEECSNLLSTIEQYEATGLHELTVKVRLEPRGADLETISGANIAFHRVLRNGLATNLHSLVLKSVCDNEILRLLGRLCSNLRHLDASSSWLVDDNGLKALCFKDPESRLMPPDNFCGDTTEWLIGVQPTELTACCQNLQEVRIQETNISELGVFMLLLLIPNLKSLGGFIYYRNAGDAIVRLSECKDKELCLSLTDLWDTCLSPEKASIVSKSAPALTSLYTRGSCLQSVEAFHNLTALTVDFDFVDFGSALEDYLIKRGEKLRKLVIVDQNHPINLEMLAEYCPNLEELGAKVEGSWSGEKGELLPRLAVCRVRITYTDPLRALLVHAHHLEQLEVMMEELLYGERLEDVTDSLFSQCLSENPLLENLRVFMLRSVCLLSPITIQLLINSCPSLKIIGDFYNWVCTDEKDLDNLITEITERNLDLVISYRGLLRPYRKNRAIVSGDNFVKPYE